MGYNTVVRHLILFAPYCLHEHVFAVICPSLSPPSNGIVNCSLGADGVPSFQDTCSFKCNPGYELIGSVTRICKSDKSWSGTEAQCVKGILSVDCYFYYCMS